MPVDLLNHLSSHMVAGTVQAVTAIALCLAVVVFCRRFAVHAEREAAISITRLVQMVLVGMALALLLQETLFIGAVILLLMAASGIAGLVATFAHAGAHLLSSRAIDAASGGVMILTDDTNGHAAIDPAASDQIYRQCAIRMTTCTVPAARPHHSDQLRSYEVK